MALVLDRSVLIGFAFDAIEKGNLNFLRVLLGAKALASADTNALPGHLSGHDLANKITILEANKSRTSLQDTELANYSQLLNDLTQRKKQELKTLLSQGLGDDLRDMMPLPKDILAMVDNQTYTAHDLTETFLDLTNIVSVDSIDENGATLLARAVAANQPGIAEFLILAGADLDFINGDLPTPRQQMRSRTEPEWTTLVAKYASKTSPKTEAIKKLEKSFVDRLNTICKKYRDDNSGLVSSFFSSTKPILAALDTVETAVKKIQDGNASALSFIEIIDALMSQPNFHTTPSLQLLENDLSKEFDFFKRKIIAATPKIAPAPRASASLVVSAPAITRSSGSTAFIMGGEASSLTIASVQALVRKETTVLVEAATAPLKEQLDALKAKNTELERKLEEQSQAMAEVKAAAVEVKEFSSMLKAAKASGGLGGVTLSRGPAPAPAALPATAPTSS